MADISPSASDRRLGVIGYPLAHTLSPAIQAAALRQLGISATYEAYETPPDRLPAFMQSLRQPQWLGVNVTVPHKHAVMPYLDELGEEARAVGAVNTILNRGEKLVGFNTDAPAFLQDAEAKLGPLAGKQVLVLGAGGAAHAVCYALKEVADVVWVWNRRPERAEELVKRFDGTLRCASQSDFTRADVIVNCTSAGLRDGESPIPDEWLPEGKRLYDLIYNPPTTRLMAAVQMRGGQAVNGLGMLIRQAALALKIWTGKEPSLDVMLEAARRQLAAHGCA